MSDSLIKSVVLHESTVQRAANHVVKQRGRGKAKIKPDGPVETVKVHPLVWEETLRQAGGDPRRIVIVSETECYVK